jgi:hypothetical protein
MAQKQPPILPTRRDDHNNPVWRIGVPVDVVRMDNSMSLTEHMGEIKDDRGHVIGLISRSIGGFVFIVTDARTHQRLAINCHDAVVNVFGDRKQYAEAPEMKHPKSVTNTKKRRRS